MTGKPAATSNTPSRRFDMGHQPRPAWPARCADLAGGRADTHHLVWVTPAWGGLFVACDNPAPGVARALICAADGRVHGHILHSPATGLHACLPAEWAAPFTATMLRIVTEHLRHTRETT